MKTHEQIIFCPECKQEQIGIIQHTFPFFTYIHTCSNCNYVIMESEWIVDEPCETI